MMIPLMRSAFSNEKETKEALSKFISATPRLSMDVECKKFEENFAHFQGTRDAVLFNSGGSANLALLQTLKNIGLLNDGDKIGFSALTWSTNVMPIIQLGMIPVPIDCNLHTLNVMSDNLLLAIQQHKLKCFFLTNVLGFAGNLFEIKSICDKYNVILIEDNCESLGTELSDTLTGNFGIASTFSFYVSHHLSTIEGGMVITNDPVISRMLRIVRANGWDRNLSEKEKKELREKHEISEDFQANYTFYDLGFNFRPTEITGFIGNFQIKYLRANIEKRFRNFLMFEKMVQKNKDIIPLTRNHLTKLSSFAFPIICNSTSNRTKYIERFSEAGVELRPIIAGNMQNQPFYKKYTKIVLDLPNTDFIHNCGFYVGNYPELTEQDLEIISNCLQP